MREEHMTTQVIQGRGKVFDFDRPEVERDVFPPYVHGGTVGVAGVCLALYVIAVLQHLVALGS
jgi:hypothetical protein